MPRSLVIGVLIDILVVWGNLVDLASLRNWLKSVRELRTVNMLMY